METTNIIPSKINTMAISAVAQEVERFALAQQMGSFFAASQFIPKAYQGKEADCIIAADTAMRLGMPPLAVMQHLFVVNGRPSWSTAFLISSVNATGKFTPFEYIWEKSADGNPDKDGMRVVAYYRDDVKKERPLKGTKITWEMVRAEGWDKKPGSKWLTMPEQMFRYRAAAFWQRAYCPEVSMGMITTEEARDIQDVDYTDLSPKDRLRQIAEAAQEAVEVEPQAQQQ